ncbi:MAG: ribosome maturation factor RimP [Cyanobacteria bacterium P01_F01_bin.143]
MTHPLIPQIVDLAEPLLQDLNLELVEIVFQTNKKTPLLKIKVRNRNQDTSLEDCERMSRLLEEKLDQTMTIPGAYVLEVSSPGISSVLTTDREFLSFKGFPVVVETVSPFKNRQQWSGRLQGRDEESLFINQKGKIMTIPRELVAKVEIDERPEQG